MTSTPSFPSTPLDTTRNTLPTPPPGLPPDTPSRVLASSSPTNNTMNASTTSDHKNSPINRIGTGKLSSSSRLGTGISPRQSSQQDPLRRNLTTRGSSNNSATGDYRNYHRAEHSPKAFHDQSLTKINDEDLAKYTEVIHHNDDGEEEYDGAKHTTASMNPSLNNTMNNNRTSSSSSPPKGLPPRPQKSQATTSPPSSPQQQIITQNMLSSNEEEDNNNNSSSSSIDGSDNNDDIEEARKLLARSPSSSEASIFDYRREFKDENDEGNETIVENLLENENENNDDDVNEASPIMKNNIETIMELSSSAEINDGTKKEAVDKLIAAADEAASRQRETLRNMERLIGSYDISAKARRVRELQRATQLQERQVSREVINTALKRFERVESVVAQMIDCIPSAEKLTKALDQQEHELNLIEVELYNVEREKDENIALDQWDKELQVREEKRRNMIANALGSSKPKRDMKCGSDEAIWTLAPPSVEVDEILDRYDPDKIFERDHPEEFKKKKEKEEEEKRKQQEEIKRINPSFDALPISITSSSDDKSSFKKKRPKSPPYNHRSPLFIDQRFTIHDLLSRAEKVFLVYVFIPMAEYSRMWSTCRESSRAAMSILATAVYSLASDHRGGIADSTSISFLLSFEWGGEAANFAVELQSVLNHLEWPKSLMMTKRIMKMNENGEEEDEDDDTEDNQDLEQFVAAATSSKKTKNKQGGDHDDDDGAFDDFDFDNSNNDKASGSKEETSPSPSSSTPQQDMFSSPSQLRSGAYTAATSGDFYQRQQQRNGPGKTIKNHSGKLLFRGPRVGITIHVGSVAEIARDEVSPGVSQSNFSGGEASSNSFNSSSPSSPSLAAAPMFLHEKAKTYIGPDVTAAMNLARHCRGGEILASSSTWEAILQGQPRTFYPSEALATQYHLRFSNLHDYQNLMGSNVSETEQQQKDNIINDMMMNNNNTSEQNSNNILLPVGLSPTVSSSFADPTSPMKNNSKNALLLNNSNSRNNINRKNQQQQHHQFSIMQIFPIDLRDRAQILGAPPHSKIGLHDFLANNNNNMNALSLSQSLSNDNINGNNNNHGYGPDGSMDLASFLSGQNGLLMTPSQFTQQTTTAKNLPEWIVSKKEGESFSCAVAVITIPNLSRILNSEEHQFGTRAWEMFRNALIETIDGVNQAFAEDMVMSLVSPTSNNLSFSSSSPSPQQQQSPMSTSSLSSSQQQAPGSTTRRRRQSITQTIAESSIRERGEDIACFTTRLDFKEAVVCFRNPQVACTWAVMYQQRLEAQVWPEGLLEFNKKVYGTEFTGTYWNCLRTCVGIATDEECYITRHRPTDLRNIDGAAFWIANEVNRLARGGEMLISEKVYGSLQREPLKITHEIEPVTDPKKTKDIETMIYAIYHEPLFSRRHDLGLVHMHNFTKYCNVMRDIEYVKSRSNGVLSMVTSSGASSSSAFPSGGTNSMNLPSAVLGGGGKGHGNSSRFDASSLSGPSKHSLSVLTTIAQSTLEEDQPHDYIDLIQITRSGAVSEKAVKVLLQIIQGGIKKGLIDPSILESVPKNTLNRTTRRLFGGGVSFYGDEDGDNSNDNDKDKTNKEKPSWNPFFSEKKSSPQKEKLALALDQLPSSTSVLVESKDIKKANGDENNSTNEKEESTSATCITVSVPGLEVESETGARVDAKALPSAPDLLPSSLAASCNSSNENEHDKKKSKNQQQQGADDLFGGEEEGKLSHYHHRDGADNNIGNNNSTTHRRRMTMDEEPESVSNKPKPEVQVPSSVGEEYYTARVSFIGEDETTDTSSSKKSSSTNQAAGNNNNNEQQPKTLDEAADPISQRLGRSLSSSNKAFVRNPKALLALLLRERLRDRLFDSATYSLLTSTASLQSSSSQAQQQQVKSLFLNDPILQQEDDLAGASSSSSTSTSTKKLPIASSLSPQQMQAVERRIDALKLDDVLLLLKSIESEEHAILMSEGHFTEKELFERDFSFYEEVAAAMKAANLKTLPRRRNAAVQAAFGPAVLVERETLFVNNNDDDNNYNNNNTNRSTSTTSRRQVFHHHTHYPGQIYHPHHHHQNNTTTATYSISSGHVEPISQLTGKRGRNLQEYLKHSGGVKVVRKEVFPDGTVRHHDHQATATANALNNNNNNNQKRRNSIRAAGTLPHVSDEEESISDLLCDFNGETVSPFNDSHDDQDDDDGNFNLEKHRYTLSNSLRALDAFSKKYLQNAADRLSAANAVPFIKDLHKIQTIFFRTQFDILFPAQNWFEFSEGETKRMYTEAAWDQGTKAIERWIKQDMAPRKDLSRNLWKLAFDRFKISKTEEDGKKSTKYSVKHACIKLVVAITTRTELLKERCQELWIQRINHMMHCIRILLRLLRGRQKTDRIFRGTSTTTSPKRESENSHHQQQQAAALRKKNSLDDPHNNNRSKGGRKSSDNLSVNGMDGRYSQNRSVSSRHSRASTRTYFSSRGTNMTSNTSDVGGSFYLNRSTNTNEEEEEEVRQLKPRRQLRRASSSSMNSSVKSECMQSENDEEDAPPTCETRPQTQQQQQKEAITTSNNININEITEHKESASTKKNGNNMIEESTTTTASAIVEKELSPRTDPKKGKNRSSSSSKSSAYLATNKAMQKATQDFTKVTMPSLPSLPFSGIPAPPADAESNPMFASAIATARALDRLKKEQEERSNSSCNNNTKVGNSSSSSSPLSSNTPNPPRASISTFFGGYNNNNAKTARTMIDSELHYKPFKFNSGNNSTNKTALSRSVERQEDTRNNENNHLQQQYSQFASSPQPARTPREELSEWITRINKAAKKHDEKANDGSSRKPTAGGRNFFK